MKSLFLALPNPTKTNKSQRTFLRRFHLANCSRFGAFHDEHKLIGKYVRLIKKRESEIDTGCVLRTLTNSRRTKLPIFNVEGRVAEEETVLSVGDITKRKSKDNIISVDYEEAALLTVAILRRMNQKAFIGFRLSGTDGSFVPSVVRLTEPEPEIFSISENGSFIEGHLEILSDEAVMAFLKFSRAYSMAQALDEDTENRSPFVPSEFLLRGISIGHELFLAQKIWSVDDVTSDRQRSRKINDMDGVLNVRSIRLEIENQVVLPLQTGFAELLENLEIRSSQEDLDDYRVMLSDKKYYGYFRAKYLEKCDNFEHARTFIAKLDAAAGVFYHFHDADQCCDLGKEKN